MYGYDGGFSYGHPYAGYGCGYPVAGYGCGYPVSGCGFGYGGFALIVVLFILLIIIGASWRI